MKKNNFINIDQRGMAKIQILSFIIILAGFLGVTIFYFLEPYLLVPPEKPKIKKIVVKNPISEKELNENIDFIKSQLSSLKADAEDTYNLIKNSKEELLNSLTENGNYFSCPQIDFTKSMLQDYTENLTYIKDWIKKNSMKIKNEELRMKLIKLAGQVSSLLKNINSVISYFQSYQNTKYKRGAQNALMKLFSKYIKMYRICDLLNREAQKL